MLIIMRRLVDKFYHHLLNHSHNLNLKFKINPDVTLLAAFYLMTYHVHFQFIPVQFLVNQVTALMMMIQNQVKVILKNN